MKPCTIEDRPSVEAYIANTTLALKDSHTEVRIQFDRLKDKYRDERYTTRYTLGELFPDEAPSTALRRELSNLKPEEYIRPVPDSVNENKPAFWEFGRTYTGKGDVYIKIRTVLLDQQCGNNHSVFIMSFHFATSPLSEEVFPYALA